MNSGFFHGRRSVAAAVLLILLATAASGSAQTISLSGGNISLTFATPAAGSDLADVVDNTSCSLTWTPGTGNPKITVKSNIGAPWVTLKVEAINISGGTSTGVVTISNAPQNLISNLSNGSCDLEYTASASLSDGAGTEVYTITYTVSGGS